MGRKTFNELDLIRSLCRDSFFAFVKEFWDVVSPQTPVWNWHIPYLCSEVQIVCERVFAGLPKEYDLVINISPGTTKSIIFSVMLQAWTWTRMPEIRHICGSHTEDLVFDLSRKCRDVVKSPKYQKCFPFVKIREDQDAKGYWINTRGGDRKACTVGGKSPMGFHAHILTVDDPIDPEGALSEAVIKSANQWMNNSLPSRKVDKDVSVIILVMQRLAPDDPSADFLEKRKDRVKLICFPSEESNKISPKECVKYYQDGLFDPVRLGKKALEDQKLNGLMAYAAQFMQDPMPMGGGLVKREWFANKIVDAAPTDLRRVRYYDKAATIDGGAYTVGILMGMDNKRNFYVLDEVRGQWSASVRNEVMRDVARRDGPDVEILVEQEPGSGGKESAEITVKELAGYNVHIDLPAARKEARADPFAAQCQAGNVYLLRALWNEPWLQEIVMFPSGKYKDRMDASAAALNRLALHSNVWLFSGSDPEDAFKIPDDVGGIPTMFPM